MTILATSVVVNADMTTASAGKTHTNTWNSPVSLQSGTPYLITFEFMGTTTSSDYFRLYGHRLDALADQPSSWGGTNDCVAIAYGYTPWTTYWKQDSIFYEMRIGLGGLVSVPLQGTLIIVN